MTSTDTRPRFSRRELTAVTEAEVRAIVGEPTCRGLELQGNAKANRGWPMPVRISLGLTAIDSRCSCYSPARFCEQVAAVLLLWARDSEAFAVEGKAEIDYVVDRKREMPRE